MKCKKSLMGIAAILILIFHFYIPFTDSIYELSFRKASYIGVELFFFLSACSIGKNTFIKFVPFIKNRLLLVYVPFVAFSVIAFFFKSWEFVRLLKVISGIELFERGGGAFLWFAPGIMILYLFCPALVALKRRFGQASLLIMLLIWVALSVILQYVLHYDTIFILVNRFPIFFTGLFYDDFRKKDAEGLSLPVIAAVMVLGGFLLFKYASLTRLMKPLKDFYYIAAIPFSVSLVALCDYISEKVRFRNIPLGFIGTISFEIYASQMIFGYDIEGAVLKKTGNGQIAFLASCLILVALAYGFYRIKLLSFAAAKAVFSRLKLKNAP